jgi:hypothetical protein
VGAGDEGLLLVAALEVVLEEARVMPLAVSRQFVTTLWVRPCDLFAVFIQLINELNSFLVRLLVLGVLAAALPPRVVVAVRPPRAMTPLAWLLLPPPLSFFGAANAV